MEWLISHYITEPRGVAVIKMVPGFDNNREKSQNFLCKVLQVCESRANDGFDLILRETLDTDSSHQLSQLLPDGSAAMSLVTLGEEQLEAGRRSDRTSETGHIELTLLHQGREEGDDVLRGAINVLNEEPVTTEDGTGEEAGLPDKLARHLSTPVQSDHQPRVCVVTYLQIYISGFN